MIEIGHIWFGASLRRTTAATEAIYLLAAHAFDDLGYRRLEWKCDSLNQASRRAAERFGFRFEGVFRSHMVVKGRNRDTAWFAITDDEWPAVRAGFLAWLEPGQPRRGRAPAARPGELIAGADIAMKVGRERVLPFSGAIALIRIGLKLEPVEVIFPHRRSRT